MAPEQAAGHVHDVGPLSDVYSLGAILYEALTGKPPFRAETPLDTLVQVLESEPERPRRLNPHLPRALEIICLRCLEKAPGERYPSAQALAEDLEHYLNGEEIEATGAGPLTRLRRWTRREPALASRLIVLAVCCIIIQVNYSVGGLVEIGLHIRVMLLFVVWGMLSVVFQSLLNRKAGQNWIPFAWAAADMAVLTVLLIVDDAISTPFLIGFPCVIATSGLWFRVPVVWFTTALSVLAYGFLVIRYVLLGHVLAKPHQNTIFIVVLIMFGFVIAYQVKRVRALSNYYEHRPLP
jgi:serine/threonine-protein kinase